MGNVKFTVVGEEVTEVINSTEMSVELVNKIMRTFIDLGWLMTEVKTEGTFELVDEDGVKFDYVLTENDGNEEPYEFEESGFVHLLVDDEPIEDRKIGYKFMSNLG
jgi:hypothetical protein